MAKQMKIYTLDEAKQQIFGSRGIVEDSYSNPILNLGFNTGSPLNATMYKPNPMLTWDMFRIQQMEREQPILRRIVEYKTSSMLKGIDISSLELTSDQIKVIQKKLKDLYKPMYSYIYQGEFYGGGAGLMLFKGDLDNEINLLKPLDISQIKKDSFLGIKPLERWFGCNPSGDLVDTLGTSSGVYDPELLGQPLYYNVRFGGKKSKSYKVHRSRLLLYNTGHLAMITKKMEQYWGVSVVELMYESLNRYNTIINAVANMFIISSTRVMKVDEMTDTSQLTQKAVDGMKNKFELMSSMSNFSNILVLGADDEFDYQSVSMANVSDVLKSQRLDLCSCAGVPMSVLFDDGVNDTQTTENAHKNIKEKQKLMMTPMYDTLIKVICKSDLGIEAPIFDISYLSIRDVSEKDKADIIEKASKSLLETYKSGAMDTETFIRSLSEICNNISDIYSNFSEEFVNTNGKLTYTDREIKVAQALNKGGDSVEKEKFGGKENNEKPTPNVKVGE